MRLRTQLTLTVTALVALVVALAGLVIVVRIDHRDRDDLDRLLAARADRVKAAATKNGSLPTDGTFAIRLIRNGEMLKQVGSSAGFPLPEGDGYATVSSGDDEWRALTQTLVTGAQMQILVSLDALEEQHDDNVLVVDLLVLLAAVLSAAGVWFATGLVLRPFQRLLSAARDLDPADPDQHLPEVKSPREVAELTTTLNDLLARARSYEPPEPDGVRLTPSPSSASSSAPSPLSPSSEAVAPSAAVAAPTVEIRAVEPPAPAPAPVEPPPAPAPVEPPPVPAAVEPPPAPVSTAADELRPSLAGLGAQLDQLMDNPDMPATQRHLLLALMADEHRRMVALLDGDA
ncbi:HAMP domain-containing protein [Actinoplanes sp. Pm04-4]|uniref:histidine kinase n=1 Tax=Paractinoplanes pyxinae TaxID=2997416 RepID=A0ABT4ATX3_9ACTN|nr:HAMP domain-containing protein [Actinoplanes pyxinae]MCY1137627.1 HAMP domain-containing protein [Actinoplanes pyxinae]